MAFHKIVDEHNTNNFDFIRLLAASMVVFSHSFFLLETPERLLSKSEPMVYLTSGQMTFGNLGVWIFFAISGYLITQSLMRSSNYATYFTKRSLRIFPALIVDILIAAFIWGPLVTKLTLGEYFSSYGTYRYLMNVNLYRLIYELPGVFTDNPIPNYVNGSMWTLPYEFTCYIGVVVLHFFFVLKNKYVFTALFFVSLIAWAMICLYTPYAEHFVPFIGLQFLYLNLIFYFGVGMLFFLYRDKIPLRFSFAVVALIVWIIAFYFNIGVPLSYFCLPYLVFWFVFEPRIRIPVAWLGDFSYGLYIYSWTVQQTIIHFLTPSISWWLMCFLSFAFTIPLAMFSWFAIEKKALLIKDRLFKRDVFPKPEVLVKQPS